MNIAVRLCAALTRPLLLSHPNRCLSSRHRHRWVLAHVSDNYRARTYRDGHVFYSPDTVLQCEDCRELCHSHLLDTTSRCAREWRAGGMLTTREYAEAYDR
jgi:hypothetical protein